MRLFASLALALMLAPHSGAARQAVFRGGAQTVAVYATVRDAQGRLVPGLTRDDFQILDDGRPAAITTFSNDVLPASIALLLDMSTSMLGEHVRVRNAALHFVDALLPDDRVRIGTFGDEIMLSPHLTSDKTVLGRVLREEVWPGGETPLWSAMHAAMTSLATETSRRVVVTLTDGIDTGCPRLIGGFAPGRFGRFAAFARFAPSSRRFATSSRRFASSSGRSGSVPDDAPSSWTTSDSAGRRGSAPDGRQSPTTGDSAGRRASVPCAGFDDVAQIALEREVMIYGIGMEGPGLGGGLIKLTDETGGGRFELLRNEDLASAFKDVLDELHHQYALGFTPVALDGRTHQLEVRVRGTGLTAKARKSYLAADR